MIKVFIPEIKGRVKTEVRGFWRNEQGKTFYDYLSIVPLHFLGVDTFEEIKRKYNQEALFILSGETGFIYSDPLNIKQLRHYIFEEVKNLKAEIKQALSVYGGVTIYKIANKYYKEIFYNEVEK